MSRCVECNSAGQLVGWWVSWVTDCTSPLDQVLKQPDLPEGAAEFYIVGCIRAMLLAAAHGHYLSDNATMNFGVLEDTVLIIDAGSRPREHTQMSKGDFNTLCMRRFWTKAQYTVQPNDFQRPQEAWRNARDM